MNVYTLAMLAAVAAVPRGDVPVVPVEVAPPTGRDRQKAARDRAHAKRKRRK